MKSKPKFKDEYVTRAIIENGICYSAKLNVSIKSPYQAVVFALELNGKNLQKMKDFSSGSDLGLLTTKKNGDINIKKNMIITTAADNYPDMETFLKFYEPTQYQVEKFMKEYLENNSNQNVIKKVNKPTRKNK